MIPMYDTKLTRDLRRDHQRGWHRDENHRRCPLCGKGARE